MDHRPQLRDQARRAGRVRPLHDCDGAHGARRIQPRARAARRCQLARVGVGADGYVDAAAGRRDVRRRRAGTASARAVDPNQRLGGDLLRDHAGAPSRRRLRANRALRDRQGRTLHRVDGVRRGDPASPPGRRQSGGSPERIRLSASGGGSCDGDCGLRDHRRRRDRARHVSLLVRREGVREVRRRARWLRRVDDAGARVDPRDAPRHHRALS